MYLKSQNERWERVAAMALESDVWIVPDINSKVILVDRLLRQHQGFGGEPVLRAHELWLQLLRGAHPECRVVPNEWLQVIAHEVLKGDQFRESPSLRGTAANLALLLAPLLFHPNREDILQDFGERHHQFSFRFAEILPSVLQIFDFFVERNWLLESWVPAALQNWGIPEFKKNLIFDLGASLTSVEADLIKQLAQECDVKLLWYSIRDAERFEYLLAPSLQFVGKDSRAERQNAGGKKYFAQFSGRLPEIRQCTSQVRTWLDAGVSPSQIAVYTPFLEQDLSVIEKYFGVEGINLRKVTQVRAQSLPSVQCLLARLSLIGGELAFSAVQSAFHEKVPTRHEKFVAAYREALDGSDLGRSPPVESQVKTWREQARTFLMGEVQSATSIAVDEFLQVAATVAPEAGRDVFVGFFAYVLEKTPESVRLSWRSWVEWLSVCASRMEIRRGEEAHDCIWVRGLTGIEEGEVSHRIFLGCVEELPAGKSLLSPTEIADLGWTYGFFLPHPEQALTQYEMQRLVDDGKTEDHFYYPITDWSGQLLTPQIFFLEGRQQWSSVAEVKSTAWERRQQELRDHLLQSDLDSKSHANTRRWRALLRDVGRIKVAPVKQQIESLSISKVERFLSCPFLLAAELRFGLKDEVTLDLNVDRRWQGQFYHRLVEKLLESDFRTLVPDQELERLVSEIRGEFSDFAISDEVWIGFKVKSIDLGRRFLKFEAAYRQQFPFARTAARELSFKVFLKKNGEWKAGQESEEGDLLVQGRIDRVDTDAEGMAIVLDYKMSTGSDFAFGAWERENKLQLSFYSWLLDAGLVDETYSDRVVGACFYDLRSWRRDIGFQTKEGIGKLFLKEAPRNITRERVEEHWLATREVIQTSVKQILCGEIDPRPVKPELCERCKWKTHCRAPHLEL